MICNGQWTTDYKQLCKTKKAESFSDSAFAFRQIINKNLFS